MHLEFLKCVNDYNYSVCGGCVLKDGIQVTIFTLLGTSNYTFTGSKHCGKRLIKNKLLTYGERNKKPVRISEMCLIMRECK